MTDFRENSCSTGGCNSSKGMCPGHALLVAFLAGMGLSEWTGIGWLGFITGTLLFFALFLGFHADLWRLVSRRS